VPAKNCWPKFLEVFASLNFREAKTSLQSADTAFFTFFQQISPQLELLIL
jgi:hypothetical protein